jgi:endonuclease/exonuclease/phosphatase family metal-dependent hydrolase
MFRKVTKKFVIICNLFIALFFLIGAFAHLFNPVKQWYFALIGLAFPYFLLIIFCFFIGWAFLKSKWAFFNIALMLICFSGINKVIGFNIFTKNTKTKIADSSILRVLHWNTASFGEFDKNRVVGSDKREKILDFIKQSNADILCLQEFFDSFHPDFSQNIKYISEKLGYPYYFHAKDYERWAPDSTNKHIKIGYWGNIIFSKYYLHDSGKINFEKDYTGKNESLSYITIEHNKQLVSIFNTHLQSIRLRKSDYENIRDIEKAKEGSLEKSISITKKIVRGYDYRKSQADTVSSILKQCKNPYLITGDFNDVPNSYTYATIKGNMQDAFLERGFGFGRTYNHLSPTLRIDYVMATNDFEILNYSKTNTSLSDHSPIIVDIKLKAKP